jgi:hypothetical protein
MTPRWLSRVAAALDVKRRRHVADARFYRLLSDSEQGTASDAKLAGVARALRAERTHAARHPLADRRRSDV